MLKPFSIVASALLLCSLGFAAELGAQVEKNPPQVATKPAAKKSSFKDFTGKVIGSNVRMRTSPDLDSHIITELSKDDYVVVSGENGDFYAVEPPSGLKAYIFRGFVIDDVVEGDRVNIRLAPDRDAPIVGHYSTGESLKGAICEDNSKWLEIPIPLTTKFFVAKEFVEYAGKSELKSIHDKRKATVTQLFDSASLLSLSEMRKAFNEIDIDRVTKNFQTIINDYADFPSYVDQATKALSQAQEDYLHRKIAFLETKTSQAKPGSLEAIYEVSDRSEEVLSPTDRMKVWEPVEEALYLTWSSMHHAKTMDDFYQDQKLKARTISGILEPYREPVKNRPGDYILKENDIPVGYLYSTHINLQEYAGKRVNLIVTERSNNHFAFPAFYVIDAE